MNALARRLSEVLAKSCTEQGMFTRVSLPQRILANEDRSIYPLEAVQQLVRLDPLAILAQLVYAHPPREAALAVARVLCERERARSAKGRRSWRVKRF